MFRKTLAGLAMATLLAAGSASATPFTTTSLTNGGQALPGGVTEIGGIVLDMVGTNNVRVVSQLSASSLFSGFSGANPFAIGTQTGFTAGVLAALGGGLQELAIRITLYDGDTAAGNFDDGENVLLVNNVAIGNFSAVQTQTTSADGLTASGALHNGFGDNVLDTGFFYTNDATSLANVYSSLVSTEQAIYQLNDVDPSDNFFDFTQGLDGSLVDVGAGPEVVVPEPGMAIIFGLGIAGLGFARRKRII